MKLNSTYASDLINENHKLYHNYETLQAENNLNKINLLEAFEIKPTNPSLIIHHF